jgi:O-antigen ligase
MSYGFSEKPKDLFSTVITVFSAAFIGIIFVAVNRSDLINNEIIVLGGTCALIILAFYFIHVFNNPKAAIPYIICTSWLVYAEPALCDILGGLAIIAFFLNSSVHKRPIEKLSLAEVALLFFIILNANNLINTYDTSFSLKHFGISIGLFAIFIYISRLSDSYNSIRKQLKLYLIPCAITSASLMLGYASETINIDIGMLGDIIVNEGRFRGFFKDCNVAAAFLILPSVYSLASILNEKGKSSPLLICVFGLLVMGIFLTFSRAAILALIFSIIIVFLYSTTDKKRFKGIFVILVVGAIIFFALSFISKSRVSGRIYDTEFGVQDRIERIQNGLEYIIKSPLIGSGMRLNESSAPHDSFLLILTQTGAIGFLLFWLPTICIMHKLLKNLRQCEDANIKIIRLTLGVSLLTYIIFGLVIYFLHWRHFWYTLGLGVAAIRLGRLEGEGISGEESGRTK